MDNEVREFVKRNKVKAKADFICVDGRYSSTKYAGMLARPGGNFRAIMVLLALRKKMGMTVGQVVDQVVDVVESRTGTFSLHTDKDPHSQIELDDIGCGHITQAENPQLAPMYEVDPYDVRKALIYLRIKLEGRKNFHIQVLDGEHREKGILIITGTKYTVNHWDQIKDEMYFVFDKARDEEFLRQHFDAFKKRFPKLSLAEFKKISDKQLMATLHNLASGLPIYEVNLDQKEPEIKFVGKVD